MADIIDPPVIDGKRYRLRVKKRFLRSPLIILEEKITQHHERDLGGSGFFDEWTTERWVPARSHRQMAIILGPA